ncbi:MAG TPA: SRPBCC domain-containing protein [Gaiellaceae bacterium]|nr:SRPBCC domain-containing protein [Gaiellaceae bacterium]
MKELRTQIEVEATPERVWEILTDFAAYPEWNPFIQRIEGEAALGSKLEVRIEPPGGRAMNFKPTVLEVAPRQELRWLGRVLVPGLFDGEHSLRIEAVDDSRVRFVQAERFTGLLVPLFGKVLEKTQRGFTAMNEALKRRAEATAS